MSQIGQKHINLQVQDSEQTPNRNSLKKPMPTYSIVKILKQQDKETNPNAAGERNSLPTGRKQRGRQWLSHQKPRRSEEEAHACSRAERKRAVSPAPRSGAHTLRGAGGGPVARGPARGGGPRRVLGREHAHGRSPGTSGMEGVAMRANTIIHFLLLSSFPDPRLRRQSRRRLMRFTHLQRKYARRLHTGGERHNFHTSLTLVRW